MKNRFFIFMFFVLVLPFLFLGNVKADALDYNRIFNLTGLSFYNNGSYITGFAKSSSNGVYWNDNIIYSGSCDELHLSLYFRNGYTNAFSSGPQTYIIPMSEDLARLFSSVNISNIDYYDNSWKLNVSKDNFNISYLNNVHGDLPGIALTIGFGISYNTTAIDLELIFDVPSGFVNVNSSSIAPFAKNVEGEYVVSPSTINTEIRLIDGLWASNHVWQYEDSRSYSYEVDSGITIGQLPTDYLSDMDLAHYYVDGVILSSDMNTRYDSSELSNLQSRSLSEDTIIYFFLKPKFFVEYSAGEMCDLNNVHSDNITFRFTNNYNSDDLSSFKYYLGKSISSYQKEQIYPYFDDLGHFQYDFIQYYNTEFELSIYDLNDNLVFLDFFTLNDSNLLSDISNFDTYVFPKDFTYAYISHIPDTDLIGLQSELNEYSKIYFYDLDSKTRFLATNFSSSLDSNNISWYSYDLDSSNHNYILMIYLDRGVFTKNTNMAFYVPSGAYVDFNKSYLISDYGNQDNKEFTIQFKNDSDEIVTSIPSDSTNASKDDENINSFSKNFSSHFKSFYQEFSFFGNFLSSLFSNIPSKLTYTIFFMFGLIVIGFIIRIWL